ncbi:MAG: HIRAN domain-containing protein, partial [Flavobacterium sp.]|nr:HIRAN domain-containing protein [Flavobacterium sp.]
MNRANFLKSFGIGAVGLIIPNTLLTQKPIKVYENYLKGSYYYKVGRHQKKLNEGDELRLEREATNPYDSFAISVHFQNHKLGYIA